MFHLSKDLLHLFARFGRMTRHGHMSLVAAGLGLEPRYHAPEACVLPLDDPANFITILPLDPPRSASKTGLGG